MFVDVYVVLFAVPQLLFGVVSTIQLLNVYPVLVAVPSAVVSVILYESAVFAAPPFVLYVTVYVLIDHCACIDTLPYLPCTFVFAAYVLPFAAQLPPVDVTFQPLNV